MRYYDTYESGLSIALMEDGVQLLDFVAPSSP